MLWRLLSLGGVFILGLLFGAGAAKDEINNLLVADVLSELESGNETSATNA